MKRPHIILSKTHVPFYSLLDGYEWLDDYLKCEELKPQLRELKEEKRRLLALPAHPDDVLESLRQSWQNYQADEIETLKTFITKNWGDPNIVARFASEANSPYTGPTFQPIPALATWEAALVELKGLPYASEAITQKEKDKKLAKLEKALSEIQAKLAEVSPPKYFMRSDAKIIVDIRQAFVHFWWDLQAQMTAPAGPQGLALELSPKPEREAWARLGLKEAVNPEGTYIPNPGE